MSVLGIHKSCYECQSSCGLLEIFTQLLLHSQKKVKHFKWQFQMLPHVTCWQNRWLNFLPELETACAIVTLFFTDTFFIFQGKERFLAWLASVLLWHSLSTIGNNSLLNSWVFPQNLQVEPEVCLSFAWLALLGFPSGLCIRICTPTSTKVFSLSSLLIHLQPHWAYPSLTISGLGMSWVFQ